MGNVVIADGIRTPFGKLGGGLGVSTLIQGL